jgi:hypothetical protein
VIVHWDDDDWSAPHRLRYELEQLGSADVGGASRVLYLDPAQRESWLYAYAGRRPWVAGNTLCYTADTWRRAPFAEIAVGEDSRFVSTRGRGIHATADHRFLVGIISSTPRTRARSARTTPGGAGCR